VQVSDWTLRNTGNRVVPTPEEADFFDAIGLPLIPPQERTVGRLWAEIRKAGKGRVA
jgi:DNA polymerase/3'-5' exonuclease PolX